MAPKKVKDQSLSLTEFASMSGEPTSSWADEEGDFKASLFQFNPPGGMPPFGAPPSGASSGPWSRGPSDFKAKVPDFPPFTARVGGVEYDITEQTIEEYFQSKGLNVSSVRLPRNAEGQVKGSAYVDFGDKESLEKALELTGEKIIERRVSIEVAEQRSNTGGFGREEFDWKRRATPGEGFGSRPPLGGGDRLDRFRTGGSMGAPEPELDWSARSGPPPVRPMMGGRMGGSGMGGGPHGGNSGPDIDWTARKGPPPVRPPPTHDTDSIDWTARKGPPAHNRSFEDRRANRAPEPELDWGARKAPPVRNNESTPRPQRSNRAEAELDWSRRNAGPVRSGRNAPASAPAPAPAPAAPAPVDDTHKKEQKRIANMTRGFKALQIDDDEEEEPAQTAESAKSSKETESIGSIQKAQREATSGDWNKV